MPLLRSLVAKNHGEGDECSRSRPDVCNANTAWVDGSFLYGSDEQRANELREGNGGKLRADLDARGFQHGPIKEVDGKPRVHKDEQ